MKRISLIYEMDEEPGWWSSYGNWIVGELGYWKPMQQRKMSKLMQLLHNMEFTWINAMDENRAVDGVNLRKRYLSETGVKANWPDGLIDEFLHENPCSLLEMFAALSIRLDRDWYGDPGDPRPDIIFHDMIDNLGLVYYTNKHFNEDEICEKCVRFLSRKITKTGKYGIFPLKKPIRDQREAEIWKQAMAYICEKY